MTRKTVQIHVSIPEDMKLKLDLLAISINDSLTSIVREALTAYLTDPVIEDALKRVSERVER